MKNFPSIENRVDFSQLGKDKFIIMSKIIENDKLVQAIGCDFSDFLSEERKIDNPSDLLKERIIPFKFVPKVDESKGTFLTLSFDEYQPTDGQKFKKGKISFWIFSQNDKQYTDYGILRTDFIVDEIHKTFCRSQKIGNIGRVEFDLLSGISVNENYHGSVLRYRVYDWM